MKKTTDLAIQAASAATGASLGVVLYSWIFVPRTRPKTLALVKTLQSVRPTKLDAVLLTGEVFGLFLIIKRLRWLKHFAQDEWVYIRIKRRQ